MKTINFGDTKIHVLGHAHVSVVANHLREIFLDYDMKDIEHSQSQVIQCIMHRVGKRLINDRNGQLRLWLNKHQCHCTIWLDFPLKVGMTEVEYGIGFHPDQRPLEAMFLLRWA